MYFPESDLEDNPSVSFEYVAAIGTGEQNPVAAPLTGAEPRPTAAPEPSAWPSPAALAEVYNSLRRCEALRNQYISKSMQIPEDYERNYDSPGNNLTFKFDGTGVYRIYTNGQARAISDVPTFRDFVKDLDTVLSIVTDGPTKSFAYRRLRYLSSTWQSYVLSYEHAERAEAKSVPYRDFYNVQKVDTHVHHSSMMSQKHLLQFIKQKVEKCGDDVVTQSSEGSTTLRELFDSLELDASNLSIDQLDMHAHQEAYQRFDTFNDKYNPAGQGKLREIFMKTDNHMRGKYLAELTHEVMDRLTRSQYQNCEWRISIYGRSKDEWDKLAGWVVDNNLFSPNVRWLIQIPRLYNVAHKNCSNIQRFSDFLKNIFSRLFEVTQYPKKEGNQNLHRFLQQVVGIDCVDDESKPDRRIHHNDLNAQQWLSPDNPPYSYWMYYLFANIASLNQFRSARKFNTLVFRPHSGEAGDTDHLAATFLTAHSISHGIMLRQSPVLIYLFYLMQIGLAMSPLSNNALFLRYEHNPFPYFFKIGLNVSLSTDDPLQFHFTEEPLLEEYSVATHIYRLSQTALAELARNSVLQSGFESDIKKKWIGETWDLPGADGNDITKTNVPNRRLRERHERLEQERKLIKQD